jgi:hypothetical protein
MTNCRGLHDFCIDCLDEKRLTCPACDGEGLANPDDDNDQTPCPRCEGKRTIPCPTCITTPTAAVHQDAANITGGLPMPVSMEINNIDEARAAATAESEELRVTAANVEIFVNGLIAGNMHNDPAVMAAVNAAKETTDLAAARWKAIVDRLNQHSDGEEYAKSGRAADTTFLNGQQ